LNALIRKGIKTPEGERRQVPSDPKHRTVADSVKVRWDVEKARPGALTPRMGRLETGGSLRASERPLLDVGSERESEQTGCQALKCVRPEDRAR